MMVEETQPDVLRRIGLIGDIHGESAELAAVLTFLQSQPNLDALLCTGDVPGKVGEGDSDACARLLLDADVRTVRGNHDRWALLDRSESIFEYSGTEVYADFARSLPAFRTFEVPFGPAMLCHGVGADDMSGIYPGGDDYGITSALKVRRIYGQFRVLLCGHTHKRLFRKLGTVTVINAGTLRHDNEPCFAILDFGQGEVRFYDIDPDNLTITSAETFRFMESETTHA